MAKIVVKIREITISELKSAMYNCALNGEGLLTSSIALVRSRADSADYICYCLETNKPIALLHRLSSSDVCLTAPCEEQFKALCEKSCLRALLRLFGNPEPTPPTVAGTMPRMIAWLEL